MYTVLEHVANDVIESGDEFGVRIGFFKDDNGEMRSFEHTEQMQDLYIGHVMECVGDEQYVWCMLLDSLEEDSIISDVVVAYAGLW